MNRSARGVPGALLILPLCAVALAMTACPPEERIYNTSSSSTGMVDAEEGTACLDGADNDDNGALDCADPGCGDEVACVAPPQLPAGWTGYYRVRTATSPDEAPAPCPDGSKPATYFAEPAGPAECSTCSCGPIEGGSCGFRPAVCFKSLSCGAGPLTLPGSLKDGACQPASNVLPSVFDASCRLTGAAAAVVEPPSCKPSPAELANPATWGSALHACGVSTTENGCEPGKICASSASDPAAERICIWHADAMSCPPGWGAPIHVFEGANDTRSCSACECKPEATCIGGDYRFYSDSLCSDGARIAWIDDTACHAFQDPMTFEAMPGQIAGGCTPQGGAPMGELLPQGPATFCCLE